MSKILNIADAMVTAINAATLSQTLTAVRVYVPKFDTESADEYQVKIAPKADGREPGGQTQDAATLMVDIGVFKRLAEFTTDAAELAEVDEALELCDELRAVVNRKRLIGVESAICTSIVQDPIYSVELLDEKRVFLTVLTCTFQTETDV